MATKSVLQELDALRSMLRPDPVMLANAYGSPSSAGGYAPTRPYTHSTPPGGEKSVDRLGRAIEAAEEEMEAALHRTTEVHKTQLRQKELEVGELQRVVAAKERDADSLRESLSATKRSYEQKVAHLESLLASRDAELSGLHAEVLALRAEREELSLRCQQGMSGISRVETELRDRTAELSSTLRAKTEEAGQAVLLAARERKEKELLMLEVVELRRELEGLESELAAAQQDAAHASNRAQEEYDARRDLEVSLDKARAAAAMSKETKDLEIAELRRRLKAEHGVRKACERWLKSELKSREEMEGLLVAVRDVALGKGPGGAAAAAEAEVGQVQALLASLGAAAEPTTAAAAKKKQQQGSGGSSSSSRGLSGSGLVAAGQLLRGELEANRHRQEFAQMKTMLGEESKRLKAELAEAKKLLQAKIHGE